MPHQNQNQAVGQLKTRSKKEKKRVPEGHVKKTENSFMLFKKFFDQQYKAYCLAKGSKAVASNKICQVAGGYWQTMSVISRKPFVAHAQRLAEQHRLAHPELAGSSRARGAVGGGADITVSAPARKRRKGEKEDAVVDLSPFVEFLELFPAKLATYEAILTTNATSATSASTSSASTPIAVTPTPTTTILSDPSQGNFIFYCAPPTAGPSSSSAPSAPRPHTHDTYTHCPPFLPTDRANINVSGTSRRPSAKRSLDQVKSEQRESSARPNEARLLFYQPTFEPFPNRSLAPDILADLLQHVLEKQVQQEQAPYWPVANNIAPGFRPVYDDCDPVDLLGEQANNPNWQQFVPMPHYPPAPSPQTDYVQHNHWQDLHEQQTYLQGTHEQVTHAQAFTHAHEASTSRIPEHNGFAMLAGDGHFDFSADLPLRYPTADPFARSFSPESPDVPWHPKSW